MAVKRSASGARILSVLETVAREQPVGVSELARLTGEDKSTVQRMLMTLADCGWIRAEAGPSTRWELTGRVETLAHHARGRNDLRRRARQALERLRDQSGETAALTILDVDGFMVAEAAESHEMLRVAPSIGQIVPGKVNASTLAVLSRMPDERVAELLGEPPTPALLEELRRIRGCGYAVRETERAGGSTNIAAPVLDARGEPVGAVVVTAPSGRLPPERHEAVGAMVSRTARSLSSHDATPMAAGFTLAASKD